MNTFTDTPELRAKAKKEALDKFTKHKDLLTGQNANSVDARRAVRSNRPQHFLLQRRVSKRRAPDGYLQTLRAPRSPPARRRSG